MLIRKCAMRKNVNENLWIAHEILGEVYDYSKYRYLSFFAQHTRHTTAVQRPAGIMYQIIDFISDYCNRSYAISIIV